MVMPKKGKVPLQIPPNEKKLAKAEPPSVLAVVDKSRSALVTLMSQVAQSLSSPLPPLELSKVMTLLKDVEQLHKDLSSAAKKQAIALLEKEGKQTTEKGSRELTVDSVVLSMRPTRTGLDPKKVEARIRAKGLEPDGFMTATVSYSLKDDTAVSLVAKKVVSQDELETLNYDKSWAVQPVKPAKEEGNE